MALALRLVADPLVIAVHMQLRRLGSMLASNVQLGRETMEWVTVRARTTIPKTPVPYHHHWMRLAPMGTRSTQTAWYGGVQLHRRAGMPVICMQVAVTREEIGNWVAGRPSCSCIFTPVWHVDPGSSRIGPSMSPTSRKQHRLCSVRPPAPSCPRERSACSAP